MLHTGPATEGRLSRGMTRRQARSGERHTFDGVAGTSGARRTAADEVCPRQGQGHRPRLRPVAGEEVRLPGVTNTRIVTSEAGCEYPNEGGFHALVAVVC